MRRVARGVARMRVARGGARGVDGGGRGARALLVAGGWCPGKVRPPPEIYFGRPPPEIDTPEIAFTPNASSERGPHPNANTLVENSATWKNVQKRTALFRFVRTAVQDRG